MFVVGWRLAGWARANTGDFVNVEVFLVLGVGLLAAALVLPTLRSRAGGPCGGCLLWLALALGCATNGGCCRYCAYVFLGHTHERADELIADPRLKLDPRQELTCDGLRLGAPKTWQPPLTKVVTDASGLVVAVHGSTMEQRSRPLVKVGDPDWMIRHVVPFAVDEEPLAVIRTEREQVRFRVSQGKVSAIELRSR